MDYIYCYSEPCARGGQVVRGEVETDAEGYPTSGDLFLWGKGEPGALIAAARADVERVEAGPDRNRPSFTRKCALAVLDYYGEEQEGDDRP